MLNRLDYGIVAALVGFAAHLLRRLLCVLNAAATGSIAGVSRSAPISISLAVFHRLCTAESVKFTSATPTCRCLHVAAHRHLSACQRRFAEFSSRLAYTHISAVLCVWSGRHSSPLPMARFGFSCKSVE
jgi:hypothetical protein